MITLSTFEVLHMFEDIKSEYDMLKNEIQILNQQKVKIDDRTKQMNEMVDTIITCYNVSF